MVDLLHKRPLAFVFTLLAGGLALAVACGGETIVEKIVVQTVIVEKVVTEKVVETVVVERQVTVIATPTPLPIEKAPAPQGKVGTLTIAMGARQVGKKAGLNSTQSGYYRWGVTEGPFMLEVPKKVTGMVVETWEVSPDTTKITLNIRHGIQFHQGWGELTAEDVAWNIDDTNSSTNPNSIHAAAGDYAAMLGDNPALVVDNDTVELTVKKFDVRWSANQFSIAAQTAQMFSKKACDEMGRDWCNDNPIGSGPFRLEEHRDDDRAILRAVDEHWRKVPAFQRLVLLEVPEEATRKAMMLTGEADMASVGLPTQSDLREAGLRVVSLNGIGGVAINYCCYWETTNALEGTPLEPWKTEPYEIDRPWIGAPSDWAVPYTDTDNPPGMDDMEQARLVRWALAMAYDKELINEAIFGGLAAPHHLGMFMPFAPEWQDKWEVAFDPAKSEEWLDQAGFPRGSDGVRFEVLLKAASHVDFFTESADAVAGFWDKIGAKTTVDKVDYRAVFRPKLVGRTNPDIYIAGCRHNTALPWDWPRGLENTSLTRGGFNCAKEIPKVVETFELVNKEPDKAKRIELNNEMADYYHNWMVESGVVVLPTNNIVYNPRSVAGWDALDTISRGIQAPEYIIPASR